MNESGENSPDSITATLPVRLFPLPGLVMFPHVVQPLHVFEPRYCEMLEEALASDRQIAMVLLLPGWERDYEGRPSIAPVACLGKVMAHERLPAGRHNILLRGLRRVAIQSELPPSRPFRQAVVDPINDVYPASGTKRRAKLQRQLVELARQLLPDSAALHDELDELLASEASLGMLTDVFSFTLGFSTAVKQRLLGEANVEQRAILLAEQLAEVARGMEPKPEGGPSGACSRFSLN